VGEDSTCEKEKHEVCKTNLGVSSCFCKPGYGRRKHRQKCQSELVERDRVERREGINLGGKRMMD
jgi:hypothetical protein